MPKGRRKSTYIKKPLIEAGPQEQAEPSNAPSMPAHLGSIARKEYQRLVALLADRKDITQIDGNALGKYCQAFEHWVIAERNLAKEGYTISGPNGLTRQNPNMAISNEAVKTMERIGRDFGLTPMARKKLAKDEEAPRTNAFITWQQSGFPPPKGANESPSP